MNQEQVKGMEGLEVAYTLTPRGHRPPKDPPASQVYHGRIEQIGHTWWNLGKQRRNGVTIHRAGRSRVEPFDHVEPVAIIDTWDAWQQRLQSREQKDEQDLRGERLARGLGGIYMRNANGGVVLLDLDTAERMMGDAEG